MSAGLSTPTAGKRPSMPPLPAFKTAAQRLSEIVVRSEDIEAYTCQNVPWYKFRKCDIASCKNNSPIVKSGCMAIDRVTPNGTKVISDAELHLFKFTGEKVSTRLVSIKRKKAVSRVKALLVLQMFIAYIQENYSHAPHNEQLFNGEGVMLHQKLYPFNVKRLGFENWMWPIVTSRTAYKQFLKSVDADATFEFDIHNLLSLTPAKLDVLRDHISKGLFHETANPRPA